MSFGDSLIKRVVETMKNEFPRLKCFATLSPIPGLRAWLQKNAPLVRLRPDHRVIVQRVWNDERQRLSGVILADEIST